MAAVRSAAEPWTPHSSSPRSGPQQMNEHGACDSGEAARAVPWSTSCSGHEHREFRGEGLRAPAVRLMRVVHTVDKRPARAGAERERSAQLVRDLPEVKARHVEFRLLLLRVEQEEVKRPRQCFVLRCARSEGGSSQIQTREAGRRLGQRRHAGAASSLLGLPAQRVAVEHAARRSTTPARPVLTHGVPDGVRDVVGDESCCERFAPAPAGPGSLERPGALRR